MVMHDGAHSLPSSAQPWWYPPASLQEERIRELYNTLQLIQISWEESTSQTALDINQHIKTAKQLLRARPLHIVLESPPEDRPFEVYVSSPSGKVILSGLITLHLLRQTMALTRGECDQLWSFNDTIWPQLLRWSDYLLPFYGDRVFEPLLQIQDHSVTPIVLNAVIGIFASIADLPKADARAHFLSDDSRALHTLICLWTHWPKIVKAHHIAIATVVQCSLLFTAAWNVFERSTADNLIGTEILRLARYDARKVLRNCGAHLRVLMRASRCAPGGTYMMRHQAEFLKAFLRDYIIGPRTLPTSFISALVDMLEDSLNDTPVHADVVNAVIEVFFTLCARSDYAVIRVLKRGVFPLIIRVRRMSQNCSGWSYFPIAFLRKSCDLLICLLSRTLCLPRAVKGFHDAQAKYASRMANVALQRDEEALIDLAEERYELLLRAESEWPPICKCCNPKCTAVKEVALRSCACAAALYCSRSCQRAHWAEHRKRCEQDQQARNETLRITRAKDVHFFAVIARAYIEENYDQIIRHLCPDGRPLEYAGIAVSLELNGASGVRCEDVSLGFKAEDDPCSYPSITVIVHYEQSDGSHARICLLTPRAAPWRRASDFLTIMDVFYDPPEDFTDQSDVD
ncbi:hypothetical protein EV715DRAFT_293937 [Schizophyllum commune]